MRHDEGNAAFARPGILQVDTPQGVEKYLEDNTLRQIATDAIVVDVQDISTSGPNEYELWFYHRPDMTGSGFPYTPNGGASPFVKWEFTSNAPTANTDLYIKRYALGTSGFELTKEFHFEYTEIVADEEWTWNLKHRDGVGTLLREEALAVELTDATSNLWTETYTDGDGTGVSRTIVEVYRDDGVIRQLVSRTINGTGFSRQYYTSGPGTGLIAITQDSTDGSWTAYKYDYDSVPGSIARIRPWLDTAVPADIGSIPDPDASGIVGTVETYVQSGDTSGRPLQITTYQDGIETGETTYSYSIASDILTITETVSTGSGSLVSVQKLDMLNEERPLSSWNADETFEAYSYEAGTYNGTTTPPSFTVGSGTDTRVVTRSGYSTDGSTVTYIPNKSVAYMAVRDDSGDLVLSGTAVCTTSTCDDGERELVSWVKREYDSQGRVTSEADSTGRLTTTSYPNGTCCGTKDVTGPDGMTISYDYNQVGELESMTVNGVSGAPEPFDSDLVTTMVDAHSSGERIETTTVSSGGKSLVTSARHDSRGRMLESTDAAGLTTTYQYATSSNGTRLVTVDPPDAGTTVRAYYRDGQQKSVSGTGVVNEAYVYEVNQDGTTATTVLIGTSDPTQVGSWPRWRRTVFDKAGRAIRSEEPAFGGGTNTTEYVYNGKGQLVRMESPAQADTVYTYDLLGEQNASGLDINTDGTLTAGSTDRFTTTASDYVKSGTTWWQRSTDTTYTIDNSSTAKIETVSEQQLTDWSEPTGNVATVGFVKVTTTITPATGSAVTTYQSTKTTIDRTTTESVQKSVLPSASNLALGTTKYGYLQSQQSPSGFATSFGYDELRRRTRVTDGRGNTTEQVYNSLGQMETYVDGDGNATTYGYASATGLLESVEDPLGRMTYSSYTDRGEVEKQWGDATYPVWFEYDDYGERTKMHTYRSTTPSGTGTWAAGGVTEWVYDAATGLLTSKIDAASESVDYDYWPAGQLKTRTWARTHLSSPLVTTYSYNSASGEIAAIDYSDTGAGADLTFTYGRNGAIKTVADINSNGTDHAFDYSKWPAEVTETISGLFDATLTRQFEADVGGRPLGLDVEFSSASVYDVDYVYDAATGRLDRVTGPGLPAYGAVYSYLEDGSNNAAADLISRLDFRSAENTTVARQSRSFDANRDLVTQVLSEWEPDGTARVIAEYGTITYDVMGRRYQVPASGEAFPTMSHLKTHFYNERGELFWLLSGCCGNKKYLYDSIGNRTYESPYAGVWEEYTTSSLNQYTDAGNHGDPSYDLDGNVVAVNSTGLVDMTYQWDTENRLTVVAPSSPSNGDMKVEYAYDYRGRMVYRKQQVYASGDWGTPTEEKYIHDDWNRILEIKPIDSVDTVTREYTWGLDVAGTLKEAGGIGGLLAITDTLATSSTADDETFLVFSDPGGNVAQLMVTSTGADFGTIGAAYDYDAYGNEVTTGITELYDQPFQFSTKPFDEVSGLGYWGYRHYDPRTGRWWSRDPIGERGGLNLYSYSANRPVDSADATGLDVIHIRPGCMHSYTYVHQTRIYKVVKMDAPRPREAISAGKTIKLAPSGCGRLYELDADKVVQGSSFGLYGVSELPPKAQIKNFKFRDGSYYVERRGMNIYYSYDLLPIGTNRGAEGYWGIWGIFPALSAALVASRGVVTREEQGGFPGWSWEVERKTQGPIDDWASFVFLESLRDNPPPFNIAQSNCWQFSHNSSLFGWDSDPPPKPPGFDPSCYYVDHAMIINTCAGD